MSQLSGTRTRSPDSWSGAAREEKEEKAVEMGRTRQRAIGVKP